LRAMECPVCLEPFLKTLVFACDNQQQHSFCQICHQQLRDEGKSCPLCNKTLTGRRNVVLENVIEQMPKWVCKNDGCDFTRVGPEPVKEHEENCCTFRLIECGRTRCGQQIRLNNLQHHLSNVHGKIPFQINLSQPQNFTIGEKQMRKKQSIYEVPFQNEKLIFFKNWVKLDETFYMFWVSYGGPKNDAQKYEYTIMIKPSKDCNVEMAKSLFKATTYCVPCDVSHEEMKKRKEAIVVGKELVKRATEGDADLYYNCTINFS